MSEHCCEICLRHGCYDGACRRPAPPESTPTEREGVAEVLVAAVCERLDPQGYGWAAGDGPSIEEVVDALAPLIAERERLAAVEALREAADAFGHMWQADPIPSASVVYRALRDRADRKAKP